MTNTKTVEKVKKPSRIRITKRNDSNFFQQFSARGLTFVGAIVLAIIFLWIVGGNNPFVSLLYIFQGTFAPVANGGLSITKLVAFLKNFVILLGIALALIPSYKMRFWNIGAQGQVLIGGLAAAFCMIYLPNAFASQLADPIGNAGAYNFANTMIILLSALSAMVAGGIWAFIPAFFKAEWKTNETLFTLMMNYIAVLLVQLFTNIWRGQKSAMGLINQNSNVGWFWTMDSANKFLSSTVFIPLILVVVLVATTYVYINYTKHGYEINVVGDSITAKYTGINVKHVIRRTVTLSGILCGIVGFFIVSNFDHTISNISDLGYGFTAVIVCWLANFNSFAMVGYSFLIVFLEKGAKNLADSGYSANLNEYSAQFIVFIIILSVMLGKFFMRYRIYYTFSRKHLMKSLTSGLLDLVPAGEEVTAKEAM